MKLPQKCPGCKRSLADPDPKLRQPRYAKYRDQFSLAKVDMDAPAEADQVTLYDPECGHRWKITATLAQLIPTS